MNDFVNALVALPEELLFRGVIQNGLSRAFGSRAAGLVVASIVFGAVHLDNPPNAVEYAAQNRGEKSDEDLRQQIEEIAADADVPLQPERLAVTHQGIATEVSA